nr:RNA-directed DNA polymerase, eukaryota [Tanacetum cinerariifolium]
MTTLVGNNSVFRSFFEKQKLTGPNFIDWYRQLCLVLSTEDKENYLEHPIPAAPVALPGQQELKAMYSKKAEQELLQTVREFHTSKQEKGQSVSSRVLKMKGYIDNLERLGQPVGQNLAVSLILVSLNKDFDSFVENYNMHGMGKTVNKLHAMLKLHEETLPKKDANPALHAIREGRTPPPPKKDNMQRTPFATNVVKLCTGEGTGLRGSKKLKPCALSLYVGDGHRAAVEAIRTYHLELPSGLVIVLNNCHYAPSITRGDISVSHLFDDGFINRFDDNNVILVSKNNLVYFMAVPRDGIFEIDMSCSNTNDSSTYAITNKRAKINLDSSLLWHYRLRHISKKRIKKLQHNGLLNSIDIESLGKYVSCMSGKMARKSYSHKVEWAKDLLGVIHTDVCGPFKIVLRQGASYFVTFTDDFSRYGYVYLLKHKHEVFETFKVFQKEVENQLGKTIKSLRSDRKDRRNRTLLDMVRSMMSQTTLPKSFWYYALETAACTLNMVPTKKVDKTPYEIWHGKAPKLPSENKVFVARNAKFFESKLLDLKASGSVEDLELIQDKDTNPSVETSLNHEDDDQEIEEPQSDINPIHKSFRTRRAPDRMCLYIDAEEHELGDLGEPANYKAALLDPESKKWLNAMNVEMQSMKDNDVWVLVELPPNARTVGSKWLFKKKTNMDGASYICKARLVTKGFTQTYRVDYEETFSLEAVWIRKFIHGLGIIPTIEEPISMYCDNTGAISIAKDDGVTKGARHFRAKVHYLRETIKLGDVKIEKVFNMGGQRSKEDEFNKISTSIFVTNFLDVFTAKELWNVCKQYGNVVDAYIPNRRSKAGKRFGFMRFIKVFDEERLVTCGYRGGKYSPLVLDESCLNQQNYSRSLMGKVKEISSLSNLKMILATEGFDNIEFKVTWVEIEGVPLKMWSENTFTRIASKWGVLLHVDDQEERCFQRKRVCIHTNILTNIFESSKIIYRGRRVKRSRCGIEKCLFLGGDSDVEEVSETKFEEEMHNSKLEEVFGGQKNSRLEDPFNIYELLNKKQGDINKDSCVDDSLKYPSGYTNKCYRRAFKQGDESKKEGGEYYQYTQEEKVVGGVKENCSNKSSNEDVAESVCSGHFKNGGSILQWMDDMVKVGQTMGYNMEGCIKNIKEIIDSQGVNEEKDLKINKNSFKAELAELDVVIDKGDGNVEVVNKRMNVVKSLQELEKLQSLEAAQKAKIKWSTEGDDNSKYYHGILNKKMNQQNIRGILAEGDIVNEVQSAFVANRQILDGPFILNEVFQWCKSKKNKSLNFKVDFEKAHDSVQWDYLDDVLKKLSFGERWCGWIQSCLRSSRGSIIVNGIPTEEFQFYKGLKQGDPLSPFLFILVMKSMHISFQRVVDTCMFKRIALGSLLSLSHLFYADDVVFMGKWSDSNIDTIVNVLDCFYQASGLHIYMSRRKLMGIFVDVNKKGHEALKIGCATLKTPFSYLGLKMKTLSIGGRLTLLKSVLGSMPIYNMSIFKVPIKVLHCMESICCHFFNGADISKRKSILVKWKNLLASTEKGGLGVLTLFALNRALMVKWVWLFLTQSSMLWARVIKAIHGDDGKIGKNAKFVLYALDSCKNIDVATKLSHSSLDYSFCQVPRGGVEQTYFAALLTKVEGVSLVNMGDRWVWSLES